MRLRKLGGTAMGGFRAKRWVPTLTLDTLLEALPPPHFVKIDVEGAELLVLEGGQVLLGRRPSLLVEVSAEHCTQISSILKDAGYNLYDADAPPHSRIPLTACVTNTLAMAAV